MNTIRYTSPAITRGHAVSTGIDLDASQGAILRPGGWVTAVSTGVAVALPAGTFGLLAIRSELGRLGIQLANTPDLIDSGYRGEIILPLTNRGDGMIALRPGTLIAQLVPVRFTQPPLAHVKRLSGPEAVSTGEN